MNFSKFSFLLLQLVLYDDVLVISGQLVVASLLKRNIKSRLLLRDLEKATKLFGKQDEDSLQVVKGDTRNAEDLDPSMFEVLSSSFICSSFSLFMFRLLRVCVGCDTCDLLHGDYSFPFTEVEWRQHTW